MMNTDDLAFQLRPNAFDGVRMNEARTPHILANGMTDGEVQVVMRQPAERAVLLATLAFTSPCTNSFVSVSICFARSSPARSTIPSTTALPWPPCWPGFWSRE